jgi:hypothetical protein
MFGFFIVGVSVNVLALITPRDVQVASPASRVANLTVDTSVHFIKLVAAKIQFTTRI